MCCVLNITEAGMQPDQPRSQTSQQLSISTIKLKSLAKLSEESRLRTNEKGMTQIEMLRHSRWVMVAFQWTRARATCKAKAEAAPARKWTTCTNPFCIGAVLPQKMYLVSFLIILHWKFSWTPVHFDILDDINFYSRLNTSRISLIRRFNTCSFWFQKVFRSLCLKNLVSWGSLACSLLWLLPTKDRSSSLPGIWWKSAFVSLECIR